MPPSQEVPPWARAMAKECADAVRGRQGDGTIFATVLDAAAMARRDAAYHLGAMLRDRAQELERQAEDIAREPADIDEANTLRYIADELQRQSEAAYAYADPPKPTSEPEVDDDIAF
jgi:hypothetical protein